MQNILRSILRIKSTSREIPNELLQKTESADNSTGGFINAPVKSSTTTAVDKEMFNSLLTEADSLTKYVLTFDKQVQYNREFVKLIKKYINYKDDKLVRVLKREEMQNRLLRNTIHNLRREVESG